MYGYIGWKLHNIKLLKLTIADCRFQILDLK